MVLRILISLSYIFLLLMDLNIFQLEEYSLKKMFCWCKTNFKECLGFVIINIFLKIIFLILNQVLSKMIYLYIVLNFTYFLVLFFVKFRKSKTPLKFTNRVIRHIAIFIICSYIYLFMLEKLNIKLGIYFYLIDFILIFLLSVGITNFIEYLIYCKYKKQAKKKLASMKDLTIIGITGSYGKTSVKNILTSILSTEFSVCATPKSFNTPNGIIKTIRNDLNDNHKIFICELGANKPNDIKVLTDILGDKLKLGIITAVGEQHLDGFKTIDAIYKTKYQLAEAVKKNNGTMFFNLENEYVKKMFDNYLDKKYGAKLNDKNKKINVLSCNLNSVNYNGSNFDLEFCNKKYKQLKTKLLGEHNVVNCMLSALVSLTLGVSEIDLRIGLNNIEKIPHRLEQKRLENGAILLDNGFNSNPFSARQSLKTLSLFSGYKIVITPGFVELGDRQYEENFILGKEISKVANELWIVNNINKNAIINGVRFNNKNDIMIKEYDNFSKDIVININKYDKNTVVLIENDLPSNYK